MARGRGHGGVTAAQPRAGTPRRRYRSESFPDSRPQPLHPGQLVVLASHVSSSAAGGSWQIRNVLLRSALGDDSLLPVVEQRLCAALDSCFSPLEQPLTVRRGIRGGDLPLLRACSDDGGETCIEFAFCSTTTDQPSADGNTLLELQVPAGTGAVWVPALPLNTFPGEQELLLERGLRLRIAAEPHAVDELGRLIYAADVLGRYDAV